MALKLVAEGPMVEIVPDVVRIGGQPLPAQWLRLIHRKSPLTISAPEIADNGSVSASGPLLYSATESAVRLTNALKVRKSECTTGGVLTRIRTRLSEIEQQVAS